MIATHQHNQPSNHYASSSLNNNQQTKQLNTNNFIKSNSNTSLNNSKNGQASFKDRQKALGQFLQPSSNRNSIPSPNQNNENILPKTGKPMPPKPPPRHDLDNQQHQQTKNSNLNFDLNPASKIKLLKLTQQQHSQPQQINNMKVTSIKYNDKYIHNNENKLVSLNTNTTTSTNRNNCKIFIQSS